MYNNYLCHHGVLGMRWGKRNGPPYPIERTASGEVSSEQKKLKSAMSSKVSDRKKRKVQRAADKAFRSEYKRQLKEDRKTESIKRLSDAELNRRIQRLKNENEYAKLLGRGKVNKEKGEALTRKALRAIGDRVIVPIAVGSSVYVLRSLAGDPYKSNAEAIKEIFKTVNEKKK